MVMKKNIKTYRFPMSAKLWTLPSIIIFTLVVSAKSWALCVIPPCTACVNPQRAVTIAHIRNEHNITRNFITQQFKYHENWIFGAGSFYGGARDSFFELHVLPAMMMMTE